MLSILTYYCRRRARGGITGSTTDDNGDQRGPLTATCSRPSGDLASDAAINGASSNRLNVGSDHHLDSCRNSGSRPALQIDAGRLEFRIERLRVGY